MSRRPLGKAKGVAALGEGEEEANGRMMVLVVLEELYFEGE